MGKFMIDSKNMINEPKKSKKHGMTSEKASRVKTRGHKKEYIYANLINGEVIKGAKKEDVRDSEGKIHTLKGGGEIKGGEGRKGKWQIFLHKLSKFENDLDFCGRDFFIKLLKSYPPNYDDYVNNKQEIKNKVAPIMAEFKGYLENKENKFNFLDKACFDKRVNYFVVYHDDSFYVFDRDEVVEVFTKNLEIENSSTFQKVVFKYEGNIFAEIEIRTTNDGKYPSILFNMLKIPAMKLLQQKISEVKIPKPLISVFGKVSGFLEDKK